MNYPSSDRIARLRFLLLAWLAFFSGGGWTAAAVAPPPASGETNILMIVLDDVGTDKMDGFDTVGHTHGRAVTLNLNALADAGIRFTNYYTNPLCSTSRACIQTGRYSFRHGIGGLSVNTPSSLRDCELTLAELLTKGFNANQGPYACGAFGKWHLNPGSICADPELETPLLQQTQAVRNGYHRFYGTLQNDNAMCFTNSQGVCGCLNTCCDPDPNNPDLPNHFDWDKVEHDEGAIDPVVIHNNSEWSADVVRRDAVSWINAQPGPFFAYVAFNPPHAAYVDPPEFSSDDERLISVGTKSELDNSPSLDASYRAMLEAVDSEVGLLLDGIGLERERKTMVFVVSDNGTPIDGLEVVGYPHPSTHGKSTVYQLGIRVPMIVSGPLAGSGICDKPVDAVDLWRTIKEITAASEDRVRLVSAPLCEGGTTDMDSISFLSLIQNPGAPATRGFSFAQRFNPGGSYVGGSVCSKTEHDRAVTNGQYKYIRKLVSGPCPSYTEEFYHVACPPPPASCARTADEAEAINLLSPPVTTLEEDLLLDAMRDYMDDLSETP